MSSGPLCVPVSADLANKLLAVLIAENKLVGKKALAKKVKLPEVGDLYDSEAGQIFIGAVQKCGKEIAVLATVVNDYTGEEELGATVAVLWSDVLEAGYEPVPSDEDEEEEDEKDEEEVVTVSRKSAKKKEGKVLPLRRN